jgi:hypothetical protein
MGQPPVLPTVSLLLSASLGNPTCPQGAIQPTLGTTGSVGATESKFAERIAVNCPRGLRDSGDEEKIEPDSFKHADECVD